MELIVILTKRADHRELLRDLQRPEEDSVIRLDVPCRRQNVNAVSVYVNFHRRVRVRKFEAPPACWPQPDWFIEMDHAICVPKLHRVQEAIENLGAQYCS